MVVEVVVDVEVVELVDVVEVVDVAAEVVDVGTGTAVDDVVAGAMVAALEPAGTVAPVLELDEQAMRIWAAMIDTTQNDRGAVICTQANQGGSDAT